jgi:hypothetical protein
MLLATQVSSCFVFDERPRPNFVEISHVLCCPLEFAPQFLTGDLICHPSPK